jgi:hypothetical protein
LQGGIAALVKFYRHISATSKNEKEEKSERKWNENALSALLPISQNKHYKTSITNRKTPSIFFIVMYGTYKS